MASEKHLFEGIGAGVVTHGALGESFAEIGAAVVAQWALRGRFS